MNHALHHFITIRSVRLLFTISLSLYAQNAGLHASEYQAQITVTEQAGTYRIEASAVINESADYVHYVLTDFIHIYRLNPSIIESEVLRVNSDGSTRVRTKVLGCTGYFCQELEQVEEVRVLPSGDLVAEILPEKSDFKSGRTVWRIIDMGEQSKLYYRSEKTPDFYIPPVVGKFMARKSIRTEIAATLENIEHVANVTAQRDWRHDYILSSSGETNEAPCFLATK
jgi:hypothetical protein